MNNATNLQFILAQTAATAPASTTTTAPAATATTATTATTTTAPAAPVTTAQQQGNPLFSLGAMALIIVGFYFIAIRPQMKAAKAQKQMAAELKPGDRVITAAGFFATIVSVDENTVTIKGLDSSRFEVLKSAIQGKVNDQAKA